MCSNVPDGRLERRRMPADEVLVELMLGTNSLAAPGKRELHTIHTTYYHCDGIGVDGGSVT
eukprot:scaffold10223_cov96-Skeletonema_dohrnii-CCMP3373.AAC.13